MEKVEYNSLLKTNNSANELTKEIVESINGYLRKNKGNAADFHLLKDIVDRHLDAVDEEINHMLPVPLYLGLAATMVGIIFGLLSLDGEVSSETFVNSIGHLIDSIKYAMICSLLGLLMTTYLSAIRYRKSKAQMEKQKNGLLNFLQMELLPHLNEDAVATLLNMQANLKMFNDNFAKNIEGFSGIMNDVHTAFDSQVQLVQQMKRMDMVQMASFNQNVLAQLQISMTEFEKFTRYLSQMNSFVHATTQLTNSVNSQLDKTNSVERVALSIRENIDKNKAVMDMLQSFLERVDENKAILKASESLDKAVSDTMDEVKKHVTSQIEEIKQYTSTATSDLEALMQRERGQLDKLKNLDKLELLVTTIKDMARDNKAYSEGLAKRLSRLSDSIDDIGGGGNALPSWANWIVAIFISIASICMIINTFFSSETSAQTVEQISNGTVDSPNAENILAGDSIF